MNETPLVLKFGGAAFSHLACYDEIADIVIEKKRRYQHLLVVVSAMAKKTDELIDLAKAVHPSPPQREFDMLVSVGERISMALLAMALEKKQCAAISLTGSQSGIITSALHQEAEITDVRPKRIHQAWKQGFLPIVAGFQGVSRFGEITTLGRGGSDTTAVALGAALGADRVEFYKDVPGIFSHDPKMNKEAVHFSYLSYDEALDVVNGGAKVLQKRSLILAKKNNMPLHVKSFSTDARCTVVEDARLSSPLFPLYEEEAREFRIQTYT